MAQENFFYIVGDALIRGNPFGYQPANGNNCVFVGFDTRRLDFKGEFAPGLHMWAGGEWHQMKPAWRQAIDRDDTRPWRKKGKKIEIWSLGVWEKIAIADRRHGLRLFEAGTGEPVLRIPTFLEVATYLYDRATAISRWQNQSGLNWIRASLRALFEQARDKERQEIDRLHRLAKLL